MPQPRSHVKIAKPRKRLGAKPGRSQVHDEDVLRWELSVPEADAVAVARQAGQGAPVLPVTHVGAKHANGRVDDLAKATRNGSSHRRTRSKGQCQGVSADCMWCRPLHCIWAA